MSVFLFYETNIPGLMRICPKYFPDERGYFLKSFEKSVFLRHGLPVTFAETNESKSSKGTLRGIHFQTEYPQGKLVRVSRGSVFLAAVDLRPDAPTFGKWQGFELTAGNREMLYLPEDFGTSFLALEDNTILSYQCTDRYSPEYEAGIMWNDKDIGIEWPLDRVKRIVISERDEKHQSFREFCHKQEKWRQESL